MSQFLVRPEDVDLVNRTATIRGEEAHHLTRVARARRGELVKLFDGAGKRWTGAVEAHERETTLICGLSPLPSNEPAALLVLAAGLIKADRWEWLIEKAVELGATEIMPLACARSQLGAEEAAKKAARWEKIILSAAKQCERGVIPALRKPMTVADFLASLPPASDNVARWAFIERAEGKRPVSASGGAVAAIGPEGGFEGRETALLLDAGFTPATLGERILRAETAAVAALALLALPQKIG